MTHAHSRSGAPGLPLALFMLALAPAIHAATDIATAPLFTASTASVKPNLMFILDDSGSMAADFLPDEADYPGYGKYASQCNGVAYNPTITYALPVDASGTPLAAGDTRALDPNPGTQTSNARSVTPNPLALQTSGSLIVTVTAANPGTNWYATGDQVTLYGNTDLTRWMEGEVATWNATTGVLTVTVKKAVGSGSVAGPLVA
jgi:type IV pilus assembly protein PilY1